MTPVRLHRIRAVSEAAVADTPAAARRAVVDLIGFATILALALYGFVTTLNRRTAAR